MPRSAPASFSRSSWDQFVILVLARSQPLDSLAMPTPVCKEEIEAVTAIFLAFVAAMQQAEGALARSGSPILSALRFRVELSTPVRVVALAAFFVGFTRSRSGPLLTSCASRSVLWLQESVGCLFLRGRSSSATGRPASRALVGSGGPAGRTISALGAFEPTTLRFLWPE
jgi:hypothetical protein